MFEARQIMDAPTTTSSDGGSGGDGFGSGSWFTPVHRLHETAADGRNSQDPQHRRDDGREQSAAADDSWFTRSHTPPPAASASAPDRDATADPTGGSPYFQPRPASTADRGPSPDAILIRRTLEEIEPISDKVTSYFYALVFLRYPQLRDMFPVAMDTQRDRLFKALLTAGRHADDTGRLTEYLSQLGRGHRKYGTLPDHYPAIGECLIGALAQYASRTWSAETEAAWVRAYTTISQIMIDAAAQDEQHTPPWWEAEVVAHERRTSDIAVVTVRPDQPYPFRAGQYASLETPWWPRVWRNYSFSCAPRPDGLLSFHVKAVPAGWVSNALVHRASPGDVIRLGPPGGSMTVDHSTDNGLLCLGGGTGIAPIKALVEEVAEHGRQRPVEVFYGARSDHDLYDIDTMKRLERAHSWLSVRPVVSERREIGAGTRFPQAVLQYGPWNAYDAYLSGPPGMIRSGVDTLVGVGIPSHRIRHDAFEEFAGAGTSSTYE
ncbi:globin domain-containing protein [Streptomyces meridianus]|uniref:nitric oxide dioxygenase n=1 Tax=Streptomyces meridianus TaxID=2938945 RepID=A0ABT0X7L9_9ACTN|nr:globin domain-containing protein [Streptomyces meridianus]MCM2578527.1 FAD-binding oxidoreductase [Streptomyces meridianus]